MLSQFYSRQNTDSHAHAKTGSYSKLPKLNFPLFDGGTPKLWISRCEDYFDLYDVSPADWIKVASMYFVDPAARWLQSLSRKVKMCSWPEFCGLVLERFGREHHELLVRQLFTICQSGSVSDYIDEFASLMDQLHAYEGVHDPLHYTMKFIDGLKPEYKSHVLMQRPTTLDTAFVLARSQEEVAVPFKKKENTRPEYGFHQRLSLRGSLPLPPPPSKLLKQPIAPAEDRRSPEAARAKSPDERWRALRAYRRAKGLCQYCADKWSKDHKCADTVQLHALQ
jgi:hypothetical protein